MGVKKSHVWKIPYNAKSIEIDGVVYKSMSEARIKTRLSRRTIENLYKRTIQFIQHISNLSITYATIVGS